MNLQDTAEGKVFDATLGEIPVLERTPYRVLVGVEPMTSDVPLRPPDGHPSRARQREVKVFDADAGWTAEELAVELPRLFGAGSRRPVPPPKDWQRRYQAKGTSATAPVSPS